MAWTMLIDVDVNCVFFKHRNDFDFSAIAESSVARLNHLDFRPGMDFLHDIQDADIREDLSYATISEDSKSVIVNYNEQLGACKGALVAGDGQGYAKIHQFIVSGRLLKNPIERMAFRDIEKAKQWLGLADDYQIKQPE
jgi:hypothetical protein